MVCKYCGNEIRDDAKFCPHCGAVSGEGPEAGSFPAAPGYPAVGTAGYSGPEAPAGGGKKKGLFIGLGVALAAAVAVTAVAVTGLFANPKGQVEKALAASYAAYETAEKALGMPDTTQWQKDRSIFQGMSLELRSINSQLTGYDLSALSGLGLSMSAGYSEADRYLTAYGGVSWGLDELFFFEMIGDDDELYLRAPQFAGETYYGVNTETLGADLARMTGDDSAEDISFNLFDLMELVLDQMDPEAMEQSIWEANKTLWQAVKVKKEGARTLDLNGTSTKTTAYHVTVPQEAMEDYVDVLMELMSSVNDSEFYEELFQSMGMPQEELEDFLEELEDTDPYGELADTLKDVLDDFGDLELEVCLSGGCLSAVLYEGELWGEEVELALYLGGNEAYVDDLRLELKADSLQITLVSTGDHGLNSGVYTDETTIQIRQFGSSTAKITSQLRYDPDAYEPGAEEGNFQWELDVTSSGFSLFQLEAQGSLYAKEDIIDLTLEDLICKTMGMELCGLRFNYRISRFPDSLIQPMEDTRLITEMSQDELLALADELERNAEEWTADMEALFLSRLPLELIYGLAYMA